MMHKVGEQAVFMRSELYRVAVDGHAAGPGIEPDAAASELALGVAGGAAQERANACENLLEMEGLGDIIVGTGIKSLDLVAPAVARGQYEDRHATAGTPPCLQDGNAVHLGQTDIQNNRIIGLGLAEKMPFLAIESAVDHVSRIGERGYELPVEIRIILNDE